MFLTAVLTRRPLPSTSIHSFLSSSPYLLKCWISSALCNDYTQNMTNTSLQPYRSQSICHLVVQSLLYGTPAHYCLLSIQQPKRFFRVIPVLKNCSWFLISLEIKSWFLEMDYLNDLTLPSPCCYCLFGLIHHAPDSTLHSVHTAP